MHILYLGGRYVKPLEYVFRVLLSSFGYSLNAPFFLLLLELLLVVLLPDSPETSLELSECVALLDIDLFLELKVDGSLLKPDRVGLVLDVESVFLIL